jgi:hypothetical protein
MARNSRHLAGIAPRAIFDVLRDGTSYSHWVVGTREIRAIEVGWPAPGTAIHYTVGYGPLRKEDHTRSLRYEPDTELELEVQIWPAGAAIVVLTVSGDESGSTVSIEERPNKGLAKLLHNPVLDLLIKLRNVETLRRLENLSRKAQAGV